MRMRGGGVGHKATRDWNTMLFEDAGRAVDDETEDNSDDGTTEMQGVEEGMEFDDDEGDNRDELGDDDGGRNDKEEDGELEDWGCVIPGASDDESGNGSDDELDESRRLVGVEEWDIYSIHAREGYSTL